MHIKIGTLTIELSFPLVAAMTAVIICDSSMSVTICFIAAIMHEAGHLIALWRYGSFPKKIKLTLFDIAIIDRNKPLRSLKKELAVILAGVTVNIAAAILSYVLNKLFPCTFFENLLTANITLAVFNSLPVDSLDGGQAVFLLLCEKMDIKMAMAVLDVISFIILVPIGCIGFLVLFRSRYNFTLLLTAVYLMALILIRKSGDIFAKVSNKHGKLKD